MRQFNRVVTQDANFCYSLQLNASSDLNHGRGMREVAKDPGKIDVYDGCSIGHFTVEVHIQGC